ncbi:helix-turn-helix transcriptional regulator [Pseudomonas denitrificans (nom. rej.)]|nr:helix-turn-helix transcriptional regulator [Pseudomonas denitrificans (nom. rej.)]
MDETSQADSGVSKIETFEGDIYFRHQSLQPDEWGAHAHPWGQINYVSQGLMYIDVGGERFVSPPHYAVWIPPNVEHSSYSTVASTYRSVYLSTAFSQKLPDKPSAITVSELLKAVLDEFARLNVCSPSSRQEMTMAQVALDQIEASTTMHAFLPYPQSPLLKSILDNVQRNLKNKRSTQEIAKAFNMTARTLERRCQTELGIGFGEWQQRIRQMKVFEELDAGLTIQQIAFELGYSSASALIKMFKRVAGMTPEQYRSQK